MIFPSSKTAYFAFVCFAMATTLSIAQEGHIAIRQDARILQLLTLKKTIPPSRYRIQIYSGNRLGAEEAHEKFCSLYAGEASSIRYEMPNFKVWVGHFRTRLEADRALRDLKKPFPDAFIFNPSTDSVDDGN